MLGRPDEQLRAVCSEQVSHQQPGRPARFGDAGGPHVFIGPAGDNPGLAAFLRRTGLPASCEPVVWLDPGQEFVIIDRTLRRDRPDLVGALEAMKVEILGQKHNAYYWIRIHTGVEAEHFDAALKGVNNALRYYAGNADPATVKGWILDGFTRFAGVQGEFMAGLGEA